MSTLEIVLDHDTDEALTTLAAERGTTPADFIAALVRDYVAAPGFRYATLAEARAHGEHPRPHAGPDPLDALVGKYEGDSVNDIDAVVYDR